MTACDADDSAPKVLMDGSDAKSPGAELEGVSPPAVLTKVRVVSATRLEHGSLAADCLRGRARDARPYGKLVERIGVNADSVTLRDASGLYGCDDSPGPRVENRRWCGGSFGQLYRGHLRDPRLDIGGCNSADGQPVASVWVEPSPGARYLVVEQPGYREVYRVAAMLPVRVSTVSGLHRDPLGATFRLSEHDATGRLLRRYRLDALPAG